MTQLKANSAEHPRGASSLHARLSHQRPVYVTESRRCLSEDRSRQHTPERSGSGSITRGEQFHVSVDLAASHTPLPQRYKATDTPIDCNGKVLWEIDDAVARATALVERIRRSSLHQRQRAAGRLALVLRRQLLRWSFSRLGKICCSLKVSVFECRLLMSSALTVSMWIKRKILLLLQGAFGQWRIYVFKSFIWQSHISATVSQAHARRLQGDLRSHQALTAADVNRHRQIERRLSVALGTMSLSNVLRKRQSHQSDSRYALARLRSEPPKGEVVARRVQLERLSFILKLAARKPLITGFNSLRLACLRSVMDDELTETIERLLAVAIPITAAAQTLHEMLPGGIKPPAVARGNRPRFPPTRRSKQQT
ncbi:hypothetical protein FOL47_004697 [Perkinsus chesapeaki]|uniref:Uncharacterized protein n=1 Tax=Perkinsus chesapeaki TaxID=330153 RepID=A0A7J6M168_PERCH|nr:hypothetical protein FOL47_004697 [Perkinsus chesapeaki]